MVMEWTAHTQCEGLLLALSTSYRLQVTGRNSDAVVKMAHNYDEWLWIITW